MKAIFWTRSEIGVVEKLDERETDLAKALQKGARVHGDEVEIRVASGAYEPEIRECDLIIMCGVKSRYWFRAYADAGIPWLYWDKGYIRERAAIKWLEYWRMSVNSHHPVKFLAAAKENRTRADSMEFRFAPWRTDRGDYVVVDGGSEKNFKFNRIVPETATIKDVGAHCEALVRRIEQLTKRPVIYRPKPSSPNRTPIEGTEFAYKTRVGVHKKDAGYDINRAHVVVTYASALSYEAHRLGIPSIVLGNGPARPIMSTSLDDLENPRLATDEERQQWLNNLAWCQFKLLECENGTAWSTVRKMMDLTPL